MPELPEVETMVRGIRPILLGSTIESVRIPPSHCRPIQMSPSIGEIQNEVVGQRIVGVTRRAKRVLIHLETLSAFVIEPRMTGLMLVSDPPTMEHLRFEWGIRNGRKKSSIWFWDRRGLGTLRLVDPAEVAHLEGNGKIGPDALVLTVEHLRHVLGTTTQPVKVALLDQKRIAGIGNLYASEILHQAKIHPALPANQLKKSQLERIQMATLAILNEAIQYEGSTLGDGTYRNALNKDGSYQNKHRVYARAGEPCLTCGKGIVERIVQAQRSTFFCEHCQK